MRIRWLVLPISWYAYDEQGVVLVYELTTGSKRHRHRGQAPSAAVVGPTAIALSQAPTGRPNSLSLRVLRNSIHQAPEKSQNQHLPKQFLLRSSLLRAHPALT